MPLSQIFPTPITKHIGHPVANSEAVQICFATRWCTLFTYGCSLSERLA